MTLDVTWAKIQPPLTDNEKDGWAFAVGTTMLVCGMDKLATDSDVVEMYTRLTIFDRLVGHPTFVSGRGVNCNTLEFWMRWQGVAINNRRTTRAAWLNRVSTEQFDKEERLVRARTDQQRTRNITKAVMAKIDAGNTKDETHVDS